MYLPNISGLMMRLRRFVGRRPTPCKGREPLNPLAPINARLNLIKISCHYRKCAVEALLPPLNPLAPSVATFHINKNTVHPSGYTVFYPYLLPIHYYFLLLLTFLAAHIYKMKHTQHRRIILREAFRKGCMVDLGQFLLF